MRKAVKIFSKIDQVDNFEDFSKIAEYMTQPSFAVFYLDNGILIGRHDINGHENATFQFDEENMKELNIEPGQNPDIVYIQKMRIFNANEELLVWRTIKCGSVMHKGRFRSDREFNHEDKCGGGVYAIYSNQVLFGTKVGKRINGFITVKEDRGVKITLPDLNKNGGFAVDNGKNRIAVRTCNYVGFGGPYGCQASYVDSRFVDFVQLS